MRASPFPGQNLYQTAVTSPCSRLALTAATVAKTPSCADQLLLKS